MLFAQKLTELKPFIPDFSNLCNIPKKAVFKGFDCHFKLTQKAQFLRSRSNSVFTCQINSHIFRVNYSTDPYLFRIVYSSSTVEPCRLILHKHREGNSNKWWPEWNKNHENIFFMFNNNNIYSFTLMSIMLTSLHSEV